MPFARYARLILAGVLMAAAALTLLIIARNVWYLSRSYTNVPYADQLVLIQEVGRKWSGQLPWNYLWSPYWGQRPLLPRLATLLSVSYFHAAMLPFNLSSLAAQCAMAALVVSLIRRLFWGRSWLFWVSAIAAVHLLFSSLHIEVLIESIGIQFTWGYASAVGAIAVLGMGRGRFELRFWMALLLAAASSACLAIGLLVWPILIVEAWIMKARLRHFLVLAGIAGSIATVYAIGYWRPDMGMGLSGMARHPIQALRILAMVLGGPISDRSRLLGTLAGAVGLVAGAAAIAGLRRARSLDPAAMLLRLLIGFFIGSAAALAAGRISPEWLAVYNGAILPSRYLLPTLAFWAVLLPVALGSGRIPGIAVCAIVAALTFGQWDWEWRFSREWAAISERYDVLASGFLVDVSDPEWMSAILVTDEVRNQSVDFMRTHRLSVFAEPRADWVGRPLPPASVAGCEVSLQPPVRLGRGFRVTGALTVDPAWRRRRLDVVMADATSTVVGLARTIPIFSEYDPTVGFIGYARTESMDPLRYWVRLPNGRWCRARANGP